MKASARRRGAPLPVPPPVRVALEPALADDPEARRALVEWVARLLVAPPPGVG